MSVIRLLIACNDRDVRVASIVATLSALPDFHVVAGRIVSTREIEVLLNAQLVDVVILMGDAPELDELGRGLLEGSRRLVVLRLTIVPPSLQISPSIGHLGIADLIDTLRSLVWSSGSPARQRLVHKKLCSAERAWRGDGAEAECLRAARLWLVALLKNCIHKQGRREGGELPGLTISQATVIRLLEQEDPAPGVEATVRVHWTALDAALAAESDRVPFAMLCDRLRLTELERQAFLLCLAPELDLRYQRALGYLHDDYGCRYPTLGLICSLLGDPVAVRSGLSASHGLSRWRLLDPPATQCLAGEPLRVERTLLGWLLDGRPLWQCDPQLRRAIREEAWPGGGLSVPHDPGREKLQGLFATAHPGDRFLLAGEPAAWRLRIEDAAVAAGTELIRIELAPLAGLAPAELEDFAARTARILALFAPMPVIDATGGAPELLADIAERVLPQITAACAYPLFLLIDAAERSRELLATATAILERSPTTTAERVAVLSNLVDTGGITVSAEEAEQLARTFALPESEAALAVGFAKAVAAGSGKDTVDAADIAATCRRLASPTLPSFAQRIEPRCTLEDVILPADRHRQLRELLAHIRHAGTVLDRWGFGEQMAYGRGVSALFCGGSGTGKTMAALACAKELESEICIVDLAQVPSKYIGETNKNLDVLFREAERAAFILLFDEADALFGKRSEVKDAHDRYANLEVAYLLQRIEAFTGLAILTTNFRQNIDSAFQRRFRFVIDFPAPDAAAREAIWKQCLPAHAPLDDDIDLQFIARRFELSGGNIQQITLRAAFSAAAEGKPIGMRHLVGAMTAVLANIGAHQPGLTERAA